MEITEERLQSFIDLYSKQFGITLNKTEAYKKASLLLYYTRLCMKPLQKITEDDILTKSNIGIKN